MLLIRHGQTVFNQVFSRTRIDPGIHDPCLTEAGRSQAAAAARALRGFGIRRLIASPYVRALETAQIIATELDLPIAVETLVAERCAYACDIGSPLGELRSLWPALAFDHLPDPWWPQEEESEASLRQRSQAFCGQIATGPWSDAAVVTHWGFIRALTGLAVPNGAVLRVDPTRPEDAAVTLFVPPPTADRAER